MFEIDTLRHAAYTYRNDQIRLALGREAAERTMYVHRYRNTSTYEIERGNMTTAAIHFGRGSDCCQGALLAVHMMGQMAAAELLDAADGGWCYVLRRKTAEAKLQCARYAAFDATVDF